MKEREQKQLTVRAGLIGEILALPQETRQALITWLRMYEFEEAERLKKKREES